MSLGFHEAYAVALKFTHCVVCMSAELTVKETELCPLSMSRYTGVVTRWNLKISLKQITRGSEDQVCSSGQMFGFGAFRTAVFVLSVLSFSFFFCSSFFYSTFV